MAIFLRSTLYLLLLCFAITLFPSCKDKEEDPVPNDQEQQNPEPNPETPGFDHADGHAITEALKIPGATLTEGSPPAPSTDPNAPVLGDWSNYQWLEDDAFFAVPGYLADIELYLDGGKDIAGDTFR